MPDQPICNFCILRSLDEQAKAQGKVLHVERSSGVIVAQAHLIAPTDDYSKFTHKQRRDTHAASFFELPETCKC